MSDPVPISALQHFVFCPRQCAYIHIECVWENNYLTAQGNQLHDRVHSNEFETRGLTRTERGVQVCSERLGITGKLDLLEIETNPFSLTPVEYKRGKVIILPNAFNMDVSALARTKHEVLQCGNRDRVRHMHTKHEQRKD